MPTREISQKDISCRPNFSRKGPDYPEDAKTEMPEEDKKWSTDNNDDQLSEIDGHQIPSKPKTVTKVPASPPSTFVNTSDANKSKSKSEDDKSSPSMQRKTEKVISLSEEKSSDNPKDDKSSSDKNVSNLAILYDIE